MTKKVIEMYNGNAGEQRIEIFAGTMKLCKENKQLAEAVEKSIEGTKFYAADESIAVNAAVTD